jgi:hypothetical protein
MNIQDHSSFITVDASPTSGCNTYVFAKKPGEAAIRWNEFSSKHLSNQISGVTAQASFTEEMSAAYAGAFGLEDIGRNFGKIFNSMTIEPIKTYLSSLETLYHELADKAFLNKFVHSPAYARGMVALGRALPADTQVNERLNYKFFTHNHINGNDELNGSLNAINEETVANYFPKGSDSQRWPNLILTSSHALVRDHHDVSGIMKGTHSLIRDLFTDITDADAMRLRLLERSDDSGETPSKGKPSILISSVHNDHNAWVNGGTLLLRLYHLDQLYAKEHQWEQAGTSDTPEHQQEREAAYLGSGDSAMSPASIRLAKLLLKLMVEEPEAVAIPERKDFEETWKDDLTLSYNDTPLTLRPDAGEILQHVKLVGYSKGGNILTDALRYLSLELQRSRGEHRLIQCQDGEQKRALQTSEIKSLLMNTGVLALNPGISPLTNHEKDMGIRRLSVRNPNDWVTAHLFARHQVKEHDGTNDDIYEVDPIEPPENLGHDPEKAMGNMDTDLKGYLVEKSKIQSDEAQFDEMESRLKCFLASCHGKSGIKSMRTHDDDSISFEFSAGASKHDTEEVTKALKTALLPALAGSGRRVVIDHDWHNGCEFRVSAPANTDAPPSENENSPPRRLQQLKKAVGDALIKLEQNQTTFVGHNVYRELAVNPPEKTKSAA